MRFVILLVVPIALCSPAVALAQATDFDSTIVDLGNPASRWACAALTTYDAATAIGFLSTAQQYSTPLGRAASYGGAITMLALAADSLHCSPDTTEIAFDFIRHDHSPTRQAEARRALEAAVRADRAWRWLSVGASLTTLALLVPMILDAPYGGDVNRGGLPALLTMTAALSTSLWRLVISLFPTRAEAALAVIERMHPSVAVTPGSAMLTMRTAF